MHPFLTTYNQNTLPKLKEAVNYRSSYALPRVSKVVVNMGIGDQQGNDKAIEELSNLIGVITGQRPVKTKARKAISGFKIRTGMVIGLAATLRGERMYDFLTKLAQIALPRTRDFRGLPPASVTADGNLNLGIRDSIIFPETVQLNTSHSLQITVVSTASTQEESRLLYEGLGFIFQDPATYQPKSKNRRRPGTYKH